MRENMFSSIRRHKNKEVEDSIPCKMSEMSTTPTK